MFGKFLNERGGGVIEMTKRTTLSFRTMRVGIVRWQERNLLRINERPQEKAAERATSFGGDFSSLLASLPSK